MLFQTTIVFTCLYSFTCLLQAGIIDYLETKDLPSTKMCPLDLQSKDRKLRNSDLLMTYMIMIAGLIAAGVVFVVEVNAIWFITLTKDEKVLLKMESTFLLIFHVQIKYR